MLTTLTCDLAGYWLLDQRRVFCAGYLSGLGNDDTYNVKGNPQLTRVNMAAAFLAEMQDFDFVTASDPLLGLLCDLEESVYDPKPEDSDLEVSLEVQHNFARAELDRRQGKRGGRERSVLLDHAAWLLQDDKMNLVNVLKWLKWNSPALAGEIDLLLGALVAESPTENTRLNRWLLQARSNDYGPHQRLRAVDEIHRWIWNRLAKGEPQSTLDERNVLCLVAPWWTRLCLSWRNSLFYWPLFRAGPKDLLDEGDHDDDLFYGMSLPVSLALVPNGERAVRFDPAPRCLELSAKWRNAFGVGLRAGNAMWRSQNSRLRLRASHKVEDKERSDLIVDMSVADQIVMVLGYSETEPHPLGGRSAEAYWAQACLNLLLDAGRAPAGVTTGCIEEVQGTLRVMPVGGLEQKLFYANSFGFSRVILPGEERALIETEAARDQPDARKTQATSPNAEAVDAYLRFLAKIEERQIDLRVEVNFCPEARTSADALQSKGWRRAAFFRLPETQRDFGDHLRRLHLSAAKPVDLSPYELRTAEKNPWRAEETEALNSLDTFLLGDTPQAVRHVSRKELDQVLGKIAGDSKEASGRVAIPRNAEAAIGKWLAWQDHQTRRGPKAHTELRRSGLGILALKSQDGDYEYRLWATIAEELDATPDWFTHFRWADKERAAKRLAILLNNSHVDRQVSRTAPPDVVVIFDEACFTGPRHTVVPFDTDFSVDWRPVLDPRWQDPSAPFLLEEHLHAGADGLVGLRSRLWPDDERRRTRIVIIQGSPAERPIRRDQGSSIPTEHLDSLERLTVFRFGFSVHGAFSILNHGCGRNELNSFPEVRRKLSELRALGFLRCTRGTFFIEPRYRVMLRGSSYLSSAPFQMQAAFALCPLLQPSKKFVSENRDKSLHAENIQEAKWHLSEAVRILPPKEQAYRMQAIQARKSLALIPRIADWDTFNELHRRGSVLLPDAYALARELFASARHVAASDGRDFQDLGHRPGKLLNVIGDYGAQIKKKQGADGASASPALEPTLDALTEECHHLFRELGGGADVPKRLARRTATHYEEAVALLGAEIDDQAQDVIGRCLGEIEDDAYLECSVEAFLDTYMIPKWWKWKIYSEGDQARRRELCRLASRSELMKSVHTDWDQKFEEPWTIFFRDLPDHGCEAELSEMLSLWWKARGSDLERRARYRDVVLGLRGQRGSLFENYVDVLHRGGSNLLTRISHSLLNEEDEMHALAYVAGLNLSDPVMAYDLVSNWRNSTPRDRGIPLNLDEWIGRSDSRGQFVGALVANPGSWAAMLCEAPEHRLRNQASGWAIARRVKQPAEMPAVNPLLLNTIRNGRIRKKWKLAAERAGTLGSEVRRENARVLAWVSKELLALAESS